jgi:CRP-like cAMP-binding protein
MFTADDAKSIALFKQIASSTDIDSFLPLLQQVSFPAGATIFQEGESDDTFFVIKKGEVEIRKSLDRKNSNSKLIAILSEGEFFGEMAVFQMQPRSTDALARTDVSLVKIRREDLLQIFQKKPQMANPTMHFITDVMMERLRSTTTELAAIYEAGRTIAAANTLPALAMSVMERLSQENIPGAEAKGFFLWNPFNEEFDLVLQEGFDVASDFSLDRSDPLVQWLMQENAPYLSFDVPTDSRILIPETHVYFGLSLIATPFITHEKLLGFLLFVNRQTRNAFSYNQMVLLAAISDFIALAIDNIRHRQEESDRARLIQTKKGYLLR